MGIYNWMKRQQIRNNPLILNVLFSLVHVVANVAKLNSITTSVRVFCHWNTSLRDDQFIEQASKQKINFFL
jgi:hypothetical protein